MRNISSDVPKVDAREESLIPVLNKCLGNTRLQQINKRENLEEFFVFITKKRFPSPNLSLCYLVLRWRWKRSWTEKLSSKFARIGGTYPTFMEDQENELVHHKQMFCSACFKHFGCRGLASTKHSIFNKEFQQRSEGEVC